MQTVGVYAFQVARQGLICLCQTLMEGHTDKSRQREVLGQPLCVAHFSRCERGFTGKHMHGNDHVEGPT